MSKKIQEIALAGPTQLEIMRYTIGQKVEFTNSSVYGLHLLPKEGVIVGTAIDKETGRFVYVVEYDGDFGSKNTIHIPPERIVPLKK